MDLIIQRYGLESLLKGWNKLILLTPLTVKFYTDNRRSQILGIVRQLLVFGLQEVKNIGQSFRAVN